MFPQFPGMWAPWGGQAPGVQFGSWLPAPGGKTAPQGAVYFGAPYQTPMGVAMAAFQYRVPLSVVESAGFNVWMRQDPNGGPGEAWDLAMNQIFPAPAK